MDYSTEPRGIYLMVDNKSFYATVECVVRGLDPLTTPLVVMSEAANVGQGLILSSSPAAKQLFGLHNVNRARDLPVDERLLVVPPRMNLYLAKNLAINEIFREFVADEDLLPYSIDESLLNLTHSWRLKSDNLLTVVQQLQTEIKLTVGGNDWGGQQSLASQGSPGHLCQAQSGWDWDHYQSYGARPLMGDSRTDDGVGD